MMLIMELLQYLGLVSNVRAYWPCPAPYALIPCECSGRNYLSLECYTQNLTTENIQNLIAANNFPREDFGELHISFSSSSPAPNPFLSNLTFRNIFIFGKNIKYFGMNMFLGSFLSLRSIEISNIEVTDKNFNWDDMNKFIKLYSISISGTLGITKIPTIASESLTHIYIVDTSIRVFPANSLTNVPNLESLLLIECHFSDSEIQSNRFSHFESLTRIDLGRSSLTKITKENFGSIASLEELALSSNAITSIEPGTFELLPNLKKLDLSFNHLTSIVSRTFSGLSSLQYLNLRDNEIDSIDPDSFKDLRKCTIDLSKHNLTTLNETWARPLFENDNNLYFENSKVADLKCDCDLAWFIDSTFLNQLQRPSDCLMDRQMKEYARINRDILQDLEC